MPEKIWLPPIEPKNSIWLRCLLVAPFCERWKLQFSLLSAAYLGTGWQWCDGDVVVSGDPPVAFICHETSGPERDRGEYEAEASLREALFGNAAEARQRDAAALGLSTGRNVRYGAALALALAGDAARAQALADDLAKRFPEDTLVKFNTCQRFSAARAELQRFFEGHRGSSGRRSV